MRIKAPYDHGSVLINGAEYYFQNFVANVPDHIGNILLSRGDYTIALDVDLPLNQADRVLFIRGAGLGDVLLCVPIIRYIKKHINPKAKIDWLCGTGEFAPLLQGVKQVDNVFSDKNLPGDLQSRYNCMVGIDYAEFKTNESFTHHRIDVFARRIKTLERVIIPDKKLEYHITADEKKWFKKHFNIKRPFVTLTTTTTCFNRVRTRDQDIELCNALIDSGYTVALIDKGRKEGFHERAINITGEYPLRQKAAVMYHADCVICPDTGILHLAAAMDVPVLSYFGAINPKLRITSPKTKTITYPVECFPCDIYTCHRGRPECVENLTTEFIIESLKNHLANVGVKH